MPYHLTPSEIARIEDELRVAPELITPTYITQLVSNYYTSVEIIYRYRRRVNLNLPVGRRTGDAPRAITWRMEQAIKELLDHAPWFYQDEIADFLFEIFGVKVDQATILRALKRIKITRKKLKAEVAQRNDKLRT
ncbi:uncharacterized protein K444DRAFT_617328 [Hyaloscypha bicolor E]|uniref:Uncharacterized protein n=1 Tax=Hyaloscypha bicolor E TaxID=1095630 RepID=A0A2J6SVR9_9HELO|nr:uncharacterized protein K444DRAFT_617328 [Hyaloscypha bicolor E]PMD54866.1 hypothetical protein K444DRAFT_617328 [Hyaloscypha bicolor E]